jgi:hypothetical protein
LVKQWKPSGGKKKTTLFQVSGNNGQKSILIPPQTSKVNAKLEVQVQPRRVSGPLPLTRCVLHVNII